jgi:hypothetical protein
MLMPYFDEEVPYISRILNPILVRLGSWTAINDQAIAVWGFLMLNQSQLNLCMEELTYIDDRVLPTVLTFVECTDETDPDDVKLSPEIQHLVKREVARINSDIPMVHRCGICGTPTSTPQYLETEFAVILCPEHSHIEPRRTAECPFCGYRFDPANNSAFHGKHSCANCSHLLNRHVIQIDHDGDWFVKVKGNRRFLEMSSDRLDEWVPPRVLFKL